MIDETTKRFEIEDRHLPALFRAADRSAIEAQRKYFQLVRVDLLVLVIGALCASFSPEDPDLGRALNVLGAFFFGCGILFTLVLTQKNFRQSWHGGRAMAESVKTLAWRYMIRAEPFVDRLNEREADALFVRSLREILDQGDALTVSLVGMEAGGAEPASEISERMREARDSDLATRKALYLSARIDDQRQWYSERSTSSRKSENVLFAWVTVAQALALAAAIVLAFAEEPTLNPTGLFAAIAAALLAWLQVKQHQELSQSYGMAAHELGLIAEQARHVDEESELSSFVADAESAISREHTLWLARRDQITR